MSGDLLWALPEAFASRKPQSPHGNRPLGRDGGLRAYSPYYRERYRDLLDKVKVEDSTLLPVTSKRELITRFDDCTRE
jgi:hypothetical protein